MRNVSSEINMNTWKLPQEKSLTAEELQLIKCQLKSSKSSGLSKRRSKPFKSSVSSVDKLLPRYLNDCWQGKHSVTQSCADAEVIMIYEGKGVKADPASYKFIFRFDKVG